MTHTISLLEGELIKFRMNKKRHTETGLIHLAEYYGELITEYERAVEVLKISFNPMLADSSFCPNCIQIIKLNSHRGICKCGVCGKDIAK